VGRRAGCGEDEEGAGANIDLSSDCHLSAMPLRLLYHSEIVALMRFWDPPT
jgi:hypothetical protein